MGEKKIPTVCDPEVKFHISERCKKSIKKSKHGAGDGIETVKKVIRLNPDFGTPIPKRNSLRKMRLRVPGLNVGKAGGYRLIYRKVVMEEVVYVLFLDTYFKGDKEDLRHPKHVAIMAEAESLLDRLLEIVWED